MEFNLAQQLSLGKEAHGCSLPSCCWEEEHCLQKPGANFLWMGACGIRLWGLALGFPKASHGLRPSLYGAVPHNPWGASLPPCSKPSHLLSKVPERQFPSWLVSTIQRAAAGSLGTAAP